MSVELTSALPSNILTTKQYEDQQAKLFSQEEDLDRTAFLTLFTTQLKNQTLWTRWITKRLCHNSLSFPHSRQ